MTKVSNFLIFSSLSLVIFPSQLSLYDSSWVILPAIGLISFVLIAFSIIIVSENLSFYLNVKCSVLFILLIIASLLSYMTTGSPRPIMVYGSLISLFIVTSNLAIRVNNVNEVVITIIFGACLTALLIYILGINEKFSFYRYKGFFTNSNSMGSFSANIIHMIIGIIYIFRKEISRTKKYLLYFILILSVIFLLASNSRAALLSVIFVLMFILFNEISKSFQISKFKVNVFYFKNFLKLFIFLSILLFFIYSYGLLDHVIDKFYSQERLSLTNFTDTRFEGWLFAIENWKWFGNGPLNDLGYNYRKVLTGHSTWISHLNKYGLIASSLFIFGILAMFKFAWTQVKINNSKIGLIFILIFLGYIVNASFETVTSTPGMMISLIIFSILFSNTKFSNSKNILK